jgi:hypothetical protein
VPIAPDDAIPQADDAIRAAVVRLSRPHPSGGAVIERAAILAEGADSGAMLRWIVAHDGRPEALAAPAASSGGLHGARPSAGVEAERLVPKRYILPSGALG